MTALHSALRLVKRINLHKSAPIRQASPLFSGLVVGKSGEMTEQTEITEQTEKL